MLQAARKPSFPTKILWTIDGCGAIATDSTGGKAASELKGPPEGGNDIASRSELSQPRAVFLKDTTVHHDEDSSLARLLRSPLVDHVLLHPDGRHFELHRLIDDFLNKFRAAKNIDDVDFLRYVKQRWVGFFSKTLINIRIHRDDSVSVALHVSGDAMAGTHGIGGKSHNGDRFRMPQQVRDGVGLRLRG